MVARPWCRGDGAEGSPCAAVGGVRGGPGRVSTGAPRCGRGYMGVVRVVELAQSADGVRLTPRAAVSGSGDEGPTWGGRAACG